MRHRFANLKRATKIALIRLGSTLLNWFEDWYFKPDDITIPRNPRHYGVFYISSKGSLGDAAMGYSIVSQIREAQPDARITFLIHRDADRDYFREFGVNTVSIEGFFNVLPSRKATRRIADLALSCSNFILPGADVLDGVYSPGGTLRRLLSGIAAERLGARVHAIGFSFSDRSSQMIRQVFHDRCQGFQITCRDPQSAARLSKVMQRPVAHGSDLAFLLPIGSCCIHPAAQTAEDHVQSWKREGRKVVIFNANPISFHNALPNIPRAHVVKELGQALDNFAHQTGAALLFLTHDNRPAFSDAVFLQEILANMRKDMPWHFVPDTVQPSDIKRLCSLSDLVVTGRMHLGIAGLGAGKTTMITDYQGKVRGLYDLFDTPELALDLNEICEGHRLAELMLSTLELSTNFESRIQSKLPEVSALSRKNLAPILE